MRRSGLRATGIVATALVAASSLVESRAAAAETYLSPGVILSWRYGKSSAFGLGLEVSANRYLLHPETTALGGFFNTATYFSSGDTRIGFGAQANWTALGAEAGWALNLPHGAESPAFSTGPMGGG